MLLCGLQLCGCRLRGPLPELRLPALQVLGLNANQLTGGLGPIRGCTALQKIFIAGNQLTGDLSALANCKNLKKVFLYNNQLSGGLEPLRDCVAIEELFLAGNQLSGDLLSQQVRPGASIPEAQGSLPRGPHAPHARVRAYTASGVPCVRAARVVWCTPGDLEPLRRCTKLKKLYLSNNQVPNLICSEP